MGIRDMEKDHKSAPDMGGLNCALKVKQFMNATKSKNKINILQKVFTARAAPISIINDSNGICFMCQFS